MVLDYLPPELALTMDCLSDGKQCLRRLRQDPIASRLERAFQVLKHEVRDVRHQPLEIKLETEMRAQFVEISDQWYLQDLYPNERQEKAVHGQGQAGRVEQLVFRHNHDREPYITVQANEFGITHIAFHSEEGTVKWISPNADRKAAFFQDGSSAKRYDSVYVVSDVRGQHLLSKVKD